MTGKIGEYQVQHIIGSGTFGKAMLVKAKDGTRQIIKLINTRQMTRADIDDATREIQILAKLVDAPFIVRYRNAFTETYEGQPYLCIVMDYCSGGDLGKLIKERKRAKRPFSETTLRTWLLQFCIALDYMHRHKILHRDLKPANVFLDSNNYLRIGDLGLSKILEFTMQQAQTQCGTPAFMAPELCKGKPYQMAADMWALGCILVEAASFDLPFKGTSFPELKRNICSANPPPIPPTYSAELRAMISKMLSKDPAQRPSARQVLESSLLSEEWAGYKSRHNQVES